MAYDPEPKAAFVVPYLHAGDLLYKVRVTYRGPAIKDLADGFKSAAAAQKWYAKSCARLARKRLAWLHTFRTNEVSWLHTFRTNEVSITQAEADFIAECDSSPQTVAESGRKGKNS